MGSRSSTPMMESPKSGRVVVVTGANKGIGYCIAQQLVEGGEFAHVVLGCRDKERGEKAAAEVGGEFMQVDLSDSSSIAAFADCIEAEYGRLDCLVNNAAIAFKASDPTPFEGQTGPTLKTNFYGTVELTELLLPLLRASKQDPGIVNIASMAGHLRQLSSDLQQQFKAEDLSMPRLKQLVAQFEAAVADGSYVNKGWGSSNYGFSKLALIAATRVWARENPNILVNACCPGFCNTDMSSNRGPRPPAEGARSAVLLAQLDFDELGPTGRFFEDCAESEW